MSLKYRLVEQKMTLGTMQGKNVVMARPVLTGKMTFKRFCAEIADGSTVDSADVKAVLDRMVTVLKRRMEEGYSVDAGELGTFRPTFGSQAVLTTAEFSVIKHIRKPRIIFTPRRDFKDLTGISYTRVNAAGEETETEQPTPTPTPQPGGGGGTTDPDEGGGGL